MDSSTENKETEEEQGPGTIDWEKVKKPLELGDLDLRYKLSQPDFIFDDKCSPESCVEETKEESVPHGPGPILNQVLSSLNLNYGEHLRGPSHCFVPTGTSISV